MVYCRTCKARFSERKGTVLERSRLPDEKVRDVLNHIREGCGPGPPAAWSMSIRTRSHATSPWPAAMPSPSTRNWYSSPKTREVQVDEKWGFVYQKEKSCIWTPLTGCGEATGTIRPSIPRAGSCSAGCRASGTGGLPTGHRGNPRPDGGADGSADHQR